MVLSYFVFEAEALLISAAELCTPGSLTSKLPDDSQSLPLFSGRDYDALRCIWLGTWAPRIKFCP